MPVPSDVMLYISLEAGTEHAERLPAERQDQTNLGANAAILYREGVEKAGRCSGGAETSDLTVATSLTWMVGSTKKPTGRHLDKHRA